MIFFKQSFIIFQMTSFDSDRIPSDLPEDLFNNHTFVEEITADDEQAFDPQVEDFGDLTSSSLGDIGIVVSVADGVVGIQGLSDIRFEK
jgi:hypothetical protein